MIELAFDGSLEGWQEQARRAYSTHIPPEQLRWIAADSSQPGLFGSTVVGLPPASTTLHVPAKFLPLARAVAFHSDSRRWHLLYTALWRIGLGERYLLEIQTDNVVSELLHMRRQVSHEVHKMHAFVRFRKIHDDDGDAFIAWYEPRHRVLRLAAPFFAERFAPMRWSISTPDLSVHWDGKRLIYSPGAPRSSVPAEDALEDTWRTYYAAIFNPARTNLRAMRTEMPTHFWKSLPELDALPQLIANAPARVATMIAQQQRMPGAQPFVPATQELPVLRQASASCAGCNLGSCATQTVFGEGPRDARVMLVGEQPGDEEDKAGRPFVGPAGKVLDDAFRILGLDRSQLYVTNAVKHFGFVERGKRRIHRTPKLVEVVACRPWLEAELDAVKPQVLVCLGATAAKSILGQQFRLTAQRGQVLHSPYCSQTMATYHPSAILRAQDSATADALFSALVHDLRLASSLAEAPTIEASTR